jgi:putative RecB family exonuclease
MTVYSHSRLSTFEQCPHKFKLRYIDKVETDVEESVEAFMGVRVHETLEKLYSDLRYQKKNSLEDLLGFLNDEWEKNWNDSIIIVKKEYGPESYQKMARKFVTDYYNRYDPFDQTKTIAIEERILINLDDSGDYKLQGYIDRLAEEKDGYYEIHDYKTNSRLPLPEYIDNDRQLALYSIGVKNRYPDAKDVRLIWHFLAFDKEIDSTRTDEELVELKQNTVRLIDTIESEEEFPTNPSRLCDWCEFKEICRQWSHLYKLKDKPANEYLNDSGVKLVNRYAELKAKQKQVKLDLYAEMEKVEEALIKFAEKEQVDVVFGSNNKVKITVSRRFASPSKHSKEREELEQFLREHDKWDEVAQLDTSAINKSIMEKKWDDQILGVLKEYVKLEESKRLYLSKINDEC